MKSHTSSSDESCSYSSDLFALSNFPASVSFSVVSPRDFFLRFVLFFFFFILSIKFVLTLGPASFVALLFALSSVFSFSWLLSEAVF